MESCQSPDADAFVGDRGLGAGVEVVGEVQSSTAEHQQVSPGDAASRDACCRCCPRRSTDSPHPLRLLPRTAPGQRADDALPSARPGVKVSIGRSVCSEHFASRDVARARVTDTPVTESHSADDGAAAFEEQGVSPDAVELSDALTSADDSESNSFVQNEAGGVLGEDARLEGPDPSRLRCRDQRVEQGAADASVPVVGVDVDAVLGDASVDEAVRDW